MPSQITIALAAGTGGIAPSLVHLAQGFIAKHPDVPGVFYFVGVAIFFGLGALVAHFFSETSAKKAFFLGIGLPALVATAQTQNLPKNLASALIPAAYAQPQAPRPLIVTNAQKLTFKPSTECKGCEVWFADPDGRVIGKEVPNSRGKWDPIIIPKGAASVGVADPKTNFKFVPVPAASSDDAFTLEFNRTYSPIKDFRRGLGNYDLKAYDPTIKVAPQ